MRTYFYLLFSLMTFAHFNLSAANTKVDTLVIGILPFQKTVNIVNEDLEYVKTKFIATFTNKTRFKVLQGEDLTKALNEDSINKSKPDYKPTVNYIVLPIINGNNASKTIKMNDNRMETGYDVYFSMKISIIDINTKKDIFNKGFYRIDYYKNKTSEMATSLNIHSFCDLFPDLINYTFPVELKITELQLGKKEKAETVTIQNIEHMYVYIKKGFFDYPNSIFEVYTLDEKGNKNVIGKLEAKKNDNGTVVFEVDKGAKDITTLFNSGQTLFVGFLDNNIAYLINKK